MNSVKQAFDKSAPTYDGARRQLIPCFDDLYRTVIKLIPHHPEDSFRVLDLGAGTGLLSLFVAEAFPRVRLTLVDLSEPMLERARMRLAHLGDRAEIVVNDYSGDLAGEFEVILSALSIHHLAADAKRALFHRVQKMLVPGGIFINADQVLGPTPALEASYRAHWLREISLLGASGETLHSALERTKEDRLDTLQSQLEWLREAGFEAVDCWYKNFGFTVYSGRKPTT